MQIDIGHFSLSAAWLLALYSSCCSFYGSWMGGRRQLVQSATNAAFSSALFSLLSLGALAKAFVSNDFRYLYVWQHSNSAMPTAYKITAVWGGMDGSMLLWAVILACYVAVSLIGCPVDTTNSPTRGSDSIGGWQRLSSWYLFFASATSCYFLGIVLFMTNPFRFIPAVRLAKESGGLNPLLQNPSMIIHPPLLYLGFTGFVVPFAYALAALVSGELNVSWLKASRFWLLVAWTALSAGIILGGNWAYIELGWGGFWAWDPVENASFLPWLIATGLLHSVMVQEHRGMLKTWNVLMGVGTYLMAVFGTFLTRSGVVQSVHAFAASSIGWVFGLFIAITLLIVFIAAIYRRGLLKPDNLMVSYLSREGVILFNNLLFAGIAFIIIWGVMLPVFSEYLTDTKTVVGPPFFNSVTGPLFLLLLALMGIGPLVGWGGTEPKITFGVLWRFARSGFFVASAVIVLLVILDPSALYAAFGIGVSVFCIWLVVADFHRAVKARTADLENSRVSAIGEVWGLLRRRPRRYGGLLVHVGAAIMAIAIIASMAFKIEKDLAMRQGERAEIGRFSLELQELTEGTAANYQALRAKIAVRKIGSEEVIGLLFPEHRYYPASDQTTTEVDIRVTLFEDLYMAFAGIEQSKGEGVSSKSIFKVFVNPLQVWLWFGSVILVLGGVLIILPMLFLFPFSASAPDMVTRVARTHSSLAQLDQGVKGS